MHAHTHARAPTSAPRAHAAQGTWDLEQSRVRLQEARARRMERQAEGEDGGHTGVDGDMDPATQARGGARGQGA